jgi:hypothetical protein
MNLVDVRHGQGALVHEAAEAAEGAYFAGRQIRDGVHAPHRQRLFTRHRLARQIP